MSFRSVLAATAIAVSLPLEAAAQSFCAPPAPGFVSAHDIERLERLAEARLSGLAAALTEPDAAARALLSALYSEGLEPVEVLAEGAYDCRIVKLGGTPALVPYGTFSCAIAMGAEGATIVKATGSQRFSGALDRAGAGYLYAGALHYADEGPIPYGADGDRDQVGCLVRLGAEEGRYLLELPFPRYESVHDLVVLTRR